MYYKLIWDDQNKLSIYCMHIHTFCINTLDFYTYIQHTYILTYIHDVNDTIIHIDIICTFLMYLFNSCVILWN